MCTADRHILTVERLLAGGDLNYFFGRLPEKASVPTKRCILLQHESPHLIGLGGNNPRGFQKYKLTHKSGLPKEREKSEAIESPPKKEKGSRKFIALIDERNGTNFLKSRAYCIMY